MNDALAPIGMALKALGGDVGAGGWTLCFRDGSSCAYRDGMMVRAAAAADAGRGRAVVDAYTGGSGGGAMQDVGGSSGGGGGGPVTATGARQPAPRPAAVAGAPPGWPQGVTTTTTVRAVAAAAAPPGFHASGAPAPSAALPQRGSVAAQLAAAALQAGLHDCDLDDEEACVICLAEPRNTVLMPCGHVVLCAACCATVMNAAARGCPICRVEIAETIELTAD
jgi:1-acyl-sn-glycerol-3-phosphate acyltransferase